MKSLSNKLKQGLPGDQVGLDLQAPLLGYTLRRYYVDLFHLSYIPSLRPGSSVLDLGGNKIDKRGEFRIDKYNLNVTYCNLSTAKSPDIQADALALPFAENSFDAIICSELLEHVPHPPSILSEAYRTLRSGGTLFICVPFMYQIHADPYDFGRYTDYYWSVTLGKMGFQKILIERQGRFWSVLAGALAAWIYMLDFERPIRFRSQVIQLVALAKQLAVKWDTDAYHSQHPFFNSFTTGFGIRTNK